MNTSGKIAVVGDLHGNFAPLNAIICEHAPAIVLQVGDFGFWPRGEQGWPPRNPPIEAGETRVHWVDGNHEDHRSLAMAIYEGREKKLGPPGVTFQRRGSSMTLPDGRTVLFVGGAKSIDSEWRKEGKSWFPQEVLQPKHLANLPDKADIVISHTAPAAFDLGMPEQSKTAVFDMSPDPSRTALDLILEKCRPSLWFFGHFHRHLSGEHGGCKWRGLSSPDSEVKGRWWTWLPDREV